LPERAERTGVSKTRWGTQKKLFSRESQF